MPSKIFGILAVVGMIGLTACTTSLKESWLDPSVTSEIHFKKVVVAVLSPNPTVRRAAEDALVARIKRTEAVPSYSLFSESEIKDRDRVKARLLEAGVDGVVVMRLIGVNQQTTWVPGAYPQPYYNMPSYWGYANTAVYDPGYMRTDTIAQMETNIYSVADEKLIYAARSETFNPGDAVTLVNDIAKAIAADLKKRGVLK
ncbi:MAG TPA: hypothetical protein VFH55_12020 [Nitrospiria bacterium]|nr:hypothetical protein [Nitrospiria bacterium]